MIPKILIQCTRNHIPDYVQAMIKEKLSPEWKYEIFNNERITQFFKDNPLEEFPDIINVFESIEIGAHKADLFRYYYMYINGGVFLDDDAMVYDITFDEIIEDYDMFLPIHNIHNIGNVVFNGFFGTSAKNKIIYETLKYTYYTAKRKINYDGSLKSYLVFLIYMYRSYLRFKNMYNIKLYTMHDIEYQNNENWQSIKIKNDKIIARHFCDTKIVPIDMN